VLKILGVLAGAMSLVALAWKGFDIGFGPTALLVLGYYERFVHVLFGWAEPLIRTQLEMLRTFLGWDLELHPHWKHVFLLMWLYFGATARISWRSGTPIHGVFYAIWGGLIALVAGIGSGTVALDNTVSNVLMAAIPVGGAFLFMIGFSAWNATFLRKAGKTWLEDFLGYAYSYVAILVMGVGALLAGTQADHVPYVRDLPSPGLALLVVLVLVAALYAIWLGARDREGPGETPWQKFRGDSMTRLGVLMLSAIAGAIAFVLTNAGLSLIGL
jgi:hypothetical protein